MSPSPSARTVPFDSTKGFIMWAHNICSALDAPSARFDVIIHGCDTCNACNYALSAPNIVVCFVINSSRASLVTSRTSLSLSRRYPLKVFIAFVFFRVVGYSRTHRLLSRVDFGVGFVSSSILASLYISYFVDISLSSSICLVVVVVVCVIYTVAAASATFCCVATSCS